MRVIDLKRKMVALHKTIKKIVFYRDKMQINLNLSASEGKSGQTGLVSEYDRGEADLSGAGQTPSQKQMDSSNQHLRVSSKSPFGDLLAYIENCGMFFPHSTLEKNQRMHLRKT